jgi:hypothetical protein
MSPGLSNDDLIQNFHLKHSIGPPQPADVVHCIYDLLHKSGTQLKIILISFWLSVRKGNDAVC